jgi:hypothetical protein
MHAKEYSQVAFDFREVQAADGRLVLEGSIRLVVPLPPQDEHLPDKVERAVEDAGQQFKRRVYQQLLEKLDAELILVRRQGKDGQGLVCRGGRPGTFKTVFGTVPVFRRRIENKADHSMETPAVQAWGTPQQVTITQGLTDAVCDAMLQESSRKSLRTVEERAGEERLLARTTVLNLVHQEGRQLRDAARCRAEVVFAADPEAARCLLPRVAESPPEESPPPMEEDAGEPWEALAGFPGATPSDAVKEGEPRRVDADTVMVQADEVCVHAQASTGGKEIRVYNAVVSTRERTCCFSEENAQNLIFLVGALLATLGVHRGDRRLLFVNDGARWIRDWFDGLQVQAKHMVLCWYHLAHRCLMNLGSACGKRRAEEIGKEVLGHLWEGRVDAALELLAQHRLEMKNRPALDQIVEYIRARRPYLPNYRARKDAGVWIASNRVEKLNDWTTSQRCKGRGMDWTRDGVVALAVLESARRNGELPVWRSIRSLPAWTTTQAA